MEVDLRVSLKSDWNLRSAGEVEGSFQNERYGDLFAKCMSTLG